MDVFREQHSSELIAGSGRSMNRFDSNSGEVNLASFGMHWEVRALGFQNAIELEGVLSPELHLRLQLQCAFQ